MDRYRTASLSSNEPLDHLNAAMETSHIDEEKAISPVGSTQEKIDEIPPYAKSSAQYGILGKLWSFENAMDRKLGVEAHGIARKFPEERDPSYAKWHNQGIYLLTTVVYYHCTELC